MNETAIDIRDAANGVYTPPNALLQVCSVNGLPYYKRYPRDFIEGTLKLSFELKTTYSFILDLIYIQGGKLPDDPRYIAGQLNVSVRKWNALRKGLIDAGKIQVGNGYLTNYRAIIELESLAKLQDKQRENRSRPNKNNDLQSPRSHHTEPEPEPDIKKEEIRKNPVVSWSQVSPDDPVLQRPDDPLAEYSEEEIGVLIIEFPLLDVTSELEALWNWAWSKGIVKDNERKGAIYGALKAKHQKLEAGRELLESRNAPIAQPSEALLQSMKAKARH